MARITLQQIADEIGVSRATVSLALRSDPSIPEATRKRVRDCAKRLNYQPNPLISALMADVRSHSEVGRGCTLAYVTPFSQELLKTLPSAVRYFQGAAARAKEFGYRLDYFCCEPEPKEQAQLARILRARGIPGALFSPGPPGYTVEMPWNTLCAATLGYTLRSPVLNRSVNHQYHTIRTALTKCLEYGYRRIGYVTVEDDNRRVGYLYEGGFLSFQQQLPAADRLPILNTLGTRNVKQWIAKYRPDVLISSRQDILGVVEEIGFQVPRDFAVVCLDRAQAQLAGIDQMPDLVGSAGMDLVIHGLMANSYGLPESPKTVLIEGKWVDGTSLPPKRKADANTHQKTDG